MSAQEVSPKRMSVSQVRAIWMNALEVVLLLMNVIREHVTRTSVLGSETR